MTLDGITEQKFRRILTYATEQNEKRREAEQEQEMNQREQEVNAIVEGLEEKLLTPQDATKAMQEAGIPNAEEYIQQYLQGELPDAFYRPSTKSALSKVTRNVVREISKYGPYMLRGPTELRKYAEEIDGQTAINSRTYDRSLEGGLIGILSTMAVGVIGSAVGVIGSGFDQDVANFIFLTGLTTNVTSMFYELHRTYIQHLAQKRKLSFQETYNKRLDVEIDSEPGLLTEDVA